LLKTTIHDCPFDDTTLIFVERSNGITIFQRDEFENAIENRVASLLASLCMDPISLIFIKGIARQDNRAEESKQGKWGEMREERWACLS
jgi:hypothetical protein